jgi:hypothetical protein
MIKKASIFLLLATSFAHAELKVLDNQELQAVQAQAGADLSLKLSLNHNVMSNADLQDATKTPTFNCTDLAYCRLAISFNKRFVQQNSGDTVDLWTKAASDPTSAAKARKLWLVMKGIQGTVNIQKLGLDGVDLVYKNDSGLDKIKPSMQLSFDASKPIQIRNFGFTALSIEQDKVLSYYDTSGNLIEETSTNPADYGYLKASTYAAKAQATGTVASGATTANNYDTGRETGFVGMQMNGNLAMQGRIMMFSCDSGHPRC